MMIDVLIPTCKPYEEIKPLMDEVRATAGVYVHLIATCQDGSASFNRNLGLKIAQSDPIIMIDDDVTHFRYGWVKRMVEVMDDNPSCVMLTAELLQTDYRLGLMNGSPPRKPGDHSVGIVPSRKLVTACCAIRPDEVRFDTRYLGSGFEDDDYSLQLREKYGDEARWLIVHDVVVVHRNEMKCQSEHWKENMRKFNEKWGVQWPHH